MEIDREKIKKELLASGRLKPKNLKIFYKDGNGNKVSFSIDDFFSSGKTIEEGKQELSRILNTVYKKLKTNGNNIFIADALYQRNITFYKNSVESEEAVEKGLERMVDKEIKKIERNEIKRKKQRAQLIKDAKKLINVLGEDIYSVFEEIQKTNNENKTLEKNKN
jgi:hypothetical protein